GHRRQRLAHRLGYFGGLAEGLRAEPVDESGDEQADEQQHRDARQDGRRNQRSALAAERAGRDEPGREYHGEKGGTRGRRQDEGTTMRTVDLRAHLLRRTDG